MIPVRTRLRAFPRHDAGGAALFFGLAAPLLFGFVGVVVDYTNWSRQKEVLRKAADSAALAVTREFQLGTPDEARMQAVARSVVDAQVKLSPGDGAVTVKTEPVRDDPEGAPPSTAASPSTKPVRGAKVTLTQRKNAILSMVAASSLTDTVVDSTARIAGGVKVCVIGLEETGGDAIRLDNRARISAGECSVHANSTSPTAVRSESAAVVTSLITCSGGGYRGGSANYAPQLPMKDCPKTSDPLAKRPSPPVSAACQYENLILGAGLHALKPGTYCGGLNLRPGAIVTLSPGVYVLKDGPLVVGPPVLNAQANLGAAIGLSVLPATLRGTHVGFYFTGTVPPRNGTVTVMRFEPHSVVELTAPKDGDMAGLLFHEDRRSAADRRFEILSDSARKLVGTIYLPRGVLDVSANQSVADQSEYTAIVVKRLELFQAPNLVLNTRYADTDVPVPLGLGPTSGQPRLTEK